ncbi:T9SS type A sorting domain-containing protein [Psychroflexus aestuariivivens]|uniref:T9SS type A sorting domain-containing protein n=1 Tax=Psychroflexus aestuariivivens TaxID=1795040 RepID=UPI000FD86F54|nr:T9SS type A sorting domain-containing protein [Psychroflexus aestuariivivens]
MKKITLLVFFILVNFNLTAQITDVEEKFTLPENLNESSGAIFFNDRLITHNDSGNQNELYELDTISGAVTRIITIDNATNVDWEDLTQDDTSIYVADIGNNNGNRTDLKIYKINKSDYLNSTNVTSEIINFNYSDQTDFTPSPNNTEWDSEAIVSFDTDLILLTKNWVTGITKAYPIPKDSGTYSVNPLPTTLDSGGLITGSTYNQLTGKLYSVGYDFTLQPFIWISENFTENDVFSGTNTQISLSSLGFEQIEAITNIGANRYLMTSESFDIPPFADDAKLISFSTNDDLLSIEDLSINRVSLYPNPVKDILIIDGVEFVSVEIYDTNARLIYHSDSQKVDISHLNKGVYLVKVNFNDYTYHVQKIIKD